MARAQSTNDAELPNYKPLFLKTSFVAILFGYLLATVAVLEWAFQNLPVSSGYQTVPGGAKPSRPGVFVSAPLFSTRHARPTRTTSFSSPTSLARPTVPIFRRQNATLHGNRTELRPPVEFESVEIQLVEIQLFPNESIGPRRQAYAPEWRDILAPIYQSWPKNMTASEFMRQYTQMNNSTGNMNDTTNAQNLTRRSPGRDAYGRLQHRPALIELRLFMEGDEVNEPGVTRLEKVQVGWWRPEVALDDEYMTWGTCEPSWNRWEYVSNRTATDAWNRNIAQGLIICTGTDFAFLENPCYERWEGLLKKAEEYERAQPPGTVKRRDMINRYNPLEVLAIDEAVRCDGVSKFGCDLDTDPNGCRGTEADSPAWHVTPDAETTITMRNEQGVITAALAAEVFHLKNPAGIITAASTRLRPSATPAPRPNQDNQLIPMTDSTGKTTGYKTKPPTPQTTITQRDPFGVATAIFTIDLPPQATLETITLTDSNGMPSATITRSPFNPFSSPSGPAGDSPAFHILTPSEYWAVSFLPVFFAVLASITADAVASSIHALMPLKDLARPEGGDARSLMSTSRMPPIVHTVYLLHRNHEPLAFLGDLLVMLMVGITALSSEAVGVKLGGYCSEDDARGCYMGVAMYAAPARTVEGLIVVCLVVLAVLWIVLRKWQSGAVMAPGSIAAVGALMKDEELREVLKDMNMNDGTGRVEKEEVVTRLGGHRYFLGWQKEDGKGEYGIWARRVERGIGTRVSPPGWRLRVKEVLSATRKQLIKRKPSWVTKDGVVKTSGFFYIVGLLILVTYYDATQRPDTPFEKFINNQDFGVRILFTAFGVLLTFFWDYYYYCKLPPSPYTTLLTTSGVAYHEPFRSLLRGASSSVFSVPRPITPFVSIFSSLARREWFVSTVALASMVLVLLYGYFGVNYPWFPVGPEGLVGQMYYICDSEVLDEFSRPEMHRKEEDGKGFSEEEVIWGQEGPRGRKYQFREMVGVSGRLRMGVDFMREKKVDAKGGGGV